MRSAYPISLFSKPPQKESGPSAFVVSVVLHSFLFSVLFITIKQARVAPRELPNRKYDVHLLDIQRTVASMHWYPQHLVRLPHTAARRSISAGGRRGRAPRVQLERVSRNFKTTRPAPQTMIQPEVPTERRTLAKIPIPQAVAWTPENIVRKRIVTPTPKPLSALQVKASLKMPNHELNPAEVSLTSTPFVTEAPMPAPGTTVPVKVDGPQVAKEIPETASRSHQLISAARVISLSNLKLQDGTAALPVINEIAQADTSGSPMLGQAAGLSPAGEDKSDSREDGTGVGHGGADSGNHGGGVTVDEGSAATPAPTANAGFAIDTGGGAPSTGETRTQHITLPKGGQYGMVVIGASPEEDYPETADLWTGRLVYTVYLQSNTAQNWILQYSLPRVPNDPPSDGSLNAPWPYDMMRPSLKYKDVILVHGFVNSKGRFEQLSVAYPPGLAEASRLLRALKEWVFRPATLNGQTARVEILLIIPGVEN
ncbi:MAG: hypothetical protein WAM66_05480 [Acidobacteriaceae bacterium]